MNPATAFATVVVDELVRAGVREAVVAPGSRSAALALAFAAADRDGRIRLHVRIDERSAGFLAIGLIRGSSLPVPVVTTSGTAVANLHPAVLEASHAGLPLLLLTADRPPELRATGANQTTDQLKLFGSAVRFFHEMGPPASRPGQVAYWRSTVARAVAMASTDHDPGPVQLNCPFVEPLVPDGDPGWLEPLDGRAGSWTTVRDAVSSAYPIGPGPRTVVVAGDGASQAARLTAEAGNWPLFAEPSSRARTGPNLISAYRLLLGHPPLADPIERVLVFGHPTLSRPVTRLLSRPDVELVVVSRSERWPDVGHRAAQVVPAVQVADPDHPGWLDRWRHADTMLRPAIDKVLADAPLSGPAIAAALAETIGADGMLVVASSNPVRDLDLAPVVPIRTIANRGLAGIDGTVSTAVGAALANAGPTYALLGDLAFLHDQNGLLIGPQEPRPDLRIVVLNDDGGGIFGLLEQAGHEHFERVFGTPHGTNLAAVCAATGIRHDVVRSTAELRAAIASPLNGIDVVEARVDRAGHRALHAALTGTLSGL